jgi:hypothetical protein
MVRHVFNGLEAGLLPQRSNGKGFCNRIHVSDIPGSIRGNNAIAYAVQRDSQVLLFLGQQGYCIRLCLLRDFQIFLRYGQNIFGRDSFCSASINSRPSSLDVIHFLRVRIALTS